MVCYPTTEVNLRFGQWSQIAKVTYCCSRHTSPCPIGTDIYRLTTSKPVMVTTRVQAKRKTMHLRTDSLSQSKLPKILKRVFRLMSFPQSRPMRSLQKRDQLSRKMHLWNNTMRPPWQSCPLNKGGRNNPPQHVRSEIRQKPLWNILQNCNLRILLCKKRVPRFRIDEFI